jgi:hypothetical protein
MDKYSKPTSDQNFNDNYKGYLNWLVQEGYNSSPFGAAKPKQKRVRKSTSKKPVAPRLPVKRTRAKGGCCEMCRQPLPLINVQGSAKSEDLVTKAILKHMPQYNELDQGLQKKIRNTVIKKATI